MKKRVEMKELRKKLSETYFGRRALALGFDFLVIAVLSVLFYIILFALLALINPEYRQPFKSLKEVINPPAQEEKLSPLGELVLSKTEKYLEKRIVELKEALKKKDLTSAEKQKIEREIAQTQEKINQIREKRGLATQGERSEKKELEKENQESTAFLNHLIEKYKWLQEILIIYTYFTFFIYFKGQTPGKKLFGLKVVKRGGGKISLWVAFERTHGYAYSASLFLVGFLQVLWDRHSLTMHDKIAGTKVIRLRKGRRTKKRGKGKKDKKVNTTKKKRLAGEKAPGKNGSPGKDDFLKKM